MRYGEDENPQIENSVTPKVVYLSRYHKKSEWAKFFGISARDFTVQIMKGGWFILSVHYREDINGNLEINEKGQDIIRIKIQEKQEVLSSTAPAVAQEIKTRVDLIRFGTLSDEHNVKLEHWTKITHEYPEWFGNFNAGRQTSPITGLKVDCKGLFLARLQQIMGSK